MKAREQGGVVDERLNVYGVQNLKIAGNLFFIWTKLDTSLNILKFRLQYRTGERRS